MMIFLYFFSIAKTINCQQDQQKEHYSWYGNETRACRAAIHMEVCVIQKSGHKKRKRNYRCDHDFSLPTERIILEKAIDQLKDQADFHKDHDAKPGHTAFYETGHRINHSCSSSCSIRSPISARYGRISS